MSSHRAIAQAVAATFLSGTIDVDELVERGTTALGKRWRWLRPLARRIVTTFDSNDLPSRPALATFLLGDRGFRRACSTGELRLVQPALTRPQIARPVFAADWEVPSLPTVTELARWLGVSITELEWFANLHSSPHMGNRSRLSHYHYRPLLKRFGQFRLIEVPKPRLKAIQRLILTAILQRIPAHTAAHGFRSARSIRTFASPHVGHRVVLRIDLRDFFPSISAARVRAIFRTAGYPEPVSILLAGLCTNATPLDAWSTASPVPSDSASAPLAIPLTYAQSRYRWPHLPQGAPTSPALANLCAYRLDARLSALAQHVEAQYTRYADDLAFSGDRIFERGISRFQLHVCATAIEEGFHVNHRKTRIMRHGTRQHLAGLVVNERLNPRRADYDRLKAMLTNCVRHGPKSQNREHHENFAAHLLGNIAFVNMVNPQRGERLRAIFEQIDWS